MITRLHVQANAHAALAHTTWHRSANFRAGKVNLGTRDFALGCLYQRRQPVDFRLQGILGCNLGLRLRFRATHMGRGDIQLGAEVADLFL